MTDLRKAAEEAARALEYELYGKHSPAPETVSALKSLRAALAAPQQEVERLRADAAFADNWQAESRLRETQLADEIKRLRAVATILDGLTGRAPTPLEWRLICDKAALVREALARGKT